LQIGTDLASFSPSTQDNLSIFLNAFKTLDQAREREAYSIGIIYCASGQVTEDAFLENSQGSPSYYEFIKSIGWMIKADEHIGFKGNMDPKVHGEFTPYYATYDHEVIFHVSTLMPNSDRQDTKKKLLYNTKVLITWVEDLDNYSLKLFKFDVCFNIIIHPLKCGLYRIKIFKSAANWSLSAGPLVDEVVVSKHILATTVRETAISACKALADDKTKPVILRKNLIEDFINTNRMDEALYQFYGALFVV